jgi:hypothetical protein
MCVGEWSILYIGERGELGDWEKSRGLDPYSTYRQNFDGGVDDC